MHMLPWQIAAKLLQQFMYDTHSQYHKATIRPWVAAEQSGTIICAHCTCMAGLGETCSNIAICLALCCRNSHSFSKKYCLPIITMWLASSYSEKCHLQFTNLLVISNSLLQRQKRKKKQKTCKFHQHHQHQP